LQDAADQYGRLKEEFGIGHQHFIAEHEIRTASPSGKWVGQKAGLCQSQTLAADC
jgi:hypothetical protein